MSEIRDELDPPFEVVEPASWRGPVLFNSPHSGSVYPRDFLANCRLDIATLRRSEDSFVDELIAGVVQTGFPMMRARPFPGRLRHASNSIRACSTAGCRPSPTHVRCVSQAAWERSRA